MKKMSKRTLARIVTFLSAGLLALALFTGGTVIKAKQLERKSEAMYQKSLTEAGEYLADIDTVLLKGLYSESPASQCAMCADLWMDAYEAKNAISSLPIADIDMERCYTYLSKVAEYAKAAEKRIATGKKLTRNDHSALLAVKERAATLANDFEKIQKIYLGTGEKIAGGIDFSFAAPRTIATNFATSEGLGALNKNLSNAPKLIYDGPYSDALSTKEAEMLKAEKEVSLKEATATAERMLQSVSGTLRYQGKRQGNIPAYSFQKGGNHLLISVKGGKVVSFNASVSPAKIEWDEEECLRSAENFLKKMGYRSMKCDYYEIANRILIANFHYMEGDVNVYTDLIKLKVNCENGKIIGFDATSYLTNHVARSPSFKLTSAQCQSAVSPYLKIKDVKKAVIPTESEKQALCYEYRAVTPEGNELLVFIDATTGEEKDILILQISQNGVLTK